MYIFQATTFDSLKVLWFHCKIIPKKVLQKNASQTKILSITLSVGKMFWDNNKVQIPRWKVLERTQIGQLGSPEMVLRELMNAERTYENN